MVVVFYYRKGGFAIFIQLQLARFAANHQSRFGPYVDSFDFQFGGNLDTVYVQTVVQSGAHFRCSRFTSSRWRPRTSRTCDLGYSEY
jgi:hypothetical protein